MKKIACLPSYYTRVITKAAQEAGLDPVKVLAGVRDRRHTLVRWNVWRDLASRGYSYFSIAKASGFDHTSVRHAHLTDRIPHSGNPLAYLNARKTKHCHERAA